MKNRSALKLTEEERDFLLNKDGLSKLEKNKLPLVVIIGSENKGISLLSQKKCDHLIKIPLKGVTSSLNASVAAAISFYHLSNP